MPNPDRRSGVSEPALVCSALASLIGAPAFCQTSLDIAFLEKAAVIDGVIDPDEWAAAAVIDQPFSQFEPDFGSDSPYRTVVRVGQTATALYVAFEAFDPEPERLAAAGTARDGSLGDDDSVAVALDSFGDNRTAYAFRTNALATQQDARIADNGAVIDGQWDAAWRTAAQRYDDRWVAEFEIPFEILRYSTGSDVSWGVNFVRTIPRRLETSMWSEPGEAIWRISRFGDLNGIELEPQEAAGWEFIPYALAVLEEDKDSDYEAGIDMRWRPSSRLGVDLTLNPDFALVEADVEEINLTRFELLVPEKRPFFLEGAEMFDQRYRQFYSRRIGDITWGAKAGGTIGSTDFSAIATSEDRAIPGGTETADYSVVRLQHGLARGSTIGLLAANRNFLGENQGSVGVDSTAFFADNLSMVSQLMRVHGPNSDGGLAWYFRPSYDTSTTHFHIRYGQIDQNVKDDVNAVGFFEDDDREVFDTNMRHIFWMDDGPLERIQPVVNYNRYRSREGVLRSVRLNARLISVFRSGWEIELQHIDEFKLFEKKFYNDRTILTVRWDGRDGRRISTYAGSGYNFDNDLTLYGARVEWPFGDRWRFSYNLTHLELGPNLEDETTTIHVFEMLYQVNPDLFAKLFVQTNSAIEKENVQLLGVWRFRPPFGSLQVAYQRGTSEQGRQSDQGDTFFTKLAWSF